MARDGSGTYSLPEAAFVSGTTIESAKVNNNFSDLASAMSQSLSKDGQTVPTASQDMAGLGHTNVRAATAATDYARADQVIGDPLSYAADTGTATAYEIAPAVPVAAYSVGQSFRFKAAHSNSGADPTLEVGGLDPGTIYWPDGSSLIAGDIPADAVVTVSISEVTTGTPTFHLETATRASEWNTVITSPPWTTGDVKLTWKAVADSGWVLMNDGTIGSATSGATTRANDDCENLFKLFWNNVNNTNAPVSGGRGGSAAADWTANKTITLPKTLGRALAVSGAGAGLTSRALGTALGEETHALTEGELAQHSHSIPISQQTVGGSGGGSGILAYADGGTIDTDDTGSGTAHNNMQPTTFLNVMVKL